MKVQDQQVEQNGVQEEEENFGPQLIAKLQVLSLFLSSLMLVN